MLLGDAEQARVDLQEVLKCTSPLEQKQFYRIDINTGSE